MSADYPDRKVWLAKRQNTHWITSQGRLIWDSMHQGTFSDGRSEEKTRIWNRRQAEKKARRARRVEIRALRKVA